VEVTVDGDGIRLRIWRSEDRDALAEVLQRSREAFAGWLPGVTADLADLDAFLEHVERAFREGTSWYYAIEDGGEPVGQCSLHDRGGGQAEIGYWVRTDRTGRGLATRAVQALARAAFDDGFSELVLHCDEANTRSAAVARKAGFTHVGTADLPADRPRTPVQSGREMRWVRRRTGRRGLVARVFGGRRRR
jgi:ribosomal-protein-serine acetyltransferase